jgi:hypothetical protein
LVSDIKIKCPNLFGRFDYGLCKNNDFSLKTQSLIENMANDFSTQKINVFYVFTPKIFGENT